MRDAVVVEPSGPRALKHGETIHALAVVDVLAHAPGFARRFDSPFVGRDASVPCSTPRFATWSAIGPATC